MNNHYHLLMETPCANLSKTMHFINSSYTTYYNKRHRRSGHLFQGRYKAILVDRDNYAKVLSCYIHLNPIRAGIVKKPEEYGWSSYQYYGDSVSDKPSFLNTDFVLGYFDSNKKLARTKYKEFLETSMKRQPGNPLSEIVGGVILGTQGFVECEGLGSNLHN